MMFPFEIAEKPRFLIYRSRHKTKKVFRHMESKIEACGALIKFCAFCNSHLPINCFSRNKSKSDGRNNRCRDCMKEYIHHRKHGIISKVDRDSYFIPDIYLVGYGRHQTYQVACLRCDSPFFCMNTVKEYENLFCDSCVDRSSERNFAKDSNVSIVNFIGNIIGWIVKTEGDCPKRNRRNYKKAYERDQYTCRYCGYNFKICEEFRPLHIDHIKPHAASGSNALNNLAVSCSVCNLIASSKWFTDFLDKKTFIREQLRVKNKKIYSAF